jgi:hypothetical protein
VVADMTRTITITLILIMTASTIIMIQSASVAVAVPTPTVPEFTMQIIAHPYDVPPVYETDQYTGKSVISQAGYHVENKSIQVQIKNQPFSYSFNGTTYHLYYGVRVKGHFGSEWVEHYSNYEAISWAKQNTMSYTKGQFVGGIQQSNSDYTMLSISASDYPNDAQLDIQVMATVGHDSQKFINENWHLMDFTVWGHYEPAVAVDTTSDWSNTQTINLSSGEATISQSTASPVPPPTQQTPPPSPTAEPTQTPTETPIQPSIQTGILPEITWEQIALAVACAVIAVLAAGLVVLWRRLPKNSFFL